MIRKWIGSCLQVARTYVHRWRFWIFGGVYVLVALLRASDGEPMLIFVSANLAAVVACFVALHLRRQFGGPAAKMVPGFATPHLVVAGAISLAIWVGVPAVQAWLSDLPAWGPIGAHAAAGLLLVLVACWRQALLLLVALPVFLIATQATLIMGKDHAFYQFLRGDRPLASGVVIALTVLAHPIAPVFLRRLSDQEISVSDDFAIEMPRSDRPVGRWDELLLRRRDAVVRHRLADAGHGWWTIQRWRIPVAISWAQMALAVTATLFIAGLIGWTNDSASAAHVGLVASSVVLIAVPLSGWHQRRGAMSLESMRPVTRQRYFGQIAAALAFDVFLWTAVASLLNCVAYYALFREGREFLGFAIVVLSFLWSAAVFLLGVGLATFRLRHWLPVMAGTIIAWAIATMFVLEKLMVVETGRPPSRSLAWWLASAVFCGLMLTAATLVRWSREDVN